MTSATPVTLRDVGRLAVPALAALAAEPLYVLTDTAVVGHLGTEPLAALAVAGTLLATAVTLCNFLAYATTGLVARRIGAGDRAGAASNLIDGTWLAVGLGVVLAVAAFVFAHPAVDLMGADGDVARMAVLYLRVSAPGLPAALLALVAAGYLRGVHDTRTTMLVALASAALNLVVEVVLIFGLGYGIGASALATVVAQWSAALAYAAALAPRLTLRSGALRPRLGPIVAQAAVGFALVVRTASLLAALTLATAVAARIGTASLAAHQVAFQVWTFLALVLDALAIAAQALIGRLLGAEDAQGARSVARQLVRIGLVAGVVLGLAVAALRPVLGHAFSDDPRVVELIAFVLAVVASMQPLNAVVFVLDGVLIGAGDFRYLAAGMLASAAVFVPAAVGVVAFERGLGALWGAIALLMVARLVAVGVRFRTDAWLVTGAVTRGGT